MSNRPTILDTMAYRVKFNRTLDHLYLKRTRKLRSLLGKPSGRPPVWDPKVRNRAIKELQALVTQARVKKRWRQILRDLEPNRSTWFFRGRDDEEIRRRFRKWVRKELPHRPGKVYAFWRKRSRCLYVGRTGGAGTRPSEQLKKRWFERATRIVVYATRKRSGIPALECMAIHRFHPKYNKYKAAKSKGARKCPLCGMHRLIRRELRAIFSFRR